MRSGEGCAASVLTWVVAAPLLHCALCTLQCAVCSMHFAVCSVYCVVWSVQCVLFSVKCGHNCTSNCEECIAAAHAGHVTGLYYTLYCAQCTSTLLFINFQSTLSYYQFLSIAPDSWTRAYHSSTHQKPHVWVVSGHSSRVMDPPKQIIAVKSKILKMILVHTFII